jgi:hypothetical protein
MYPARSLPHPGQAKYPGKGQGSKQAIIAAITSFVMYTKQERMMVCIDRY